MAKCDEAVSQTPKAANADGPKSATTLKTGPVTDGQDGRAHVTRTDNGISSSDTTNGVSDDTKTGRDPLIEGQLDSPATARRNAKLLLTFKKSATSSCEKDAGISTGRAIKVLKIGLRNGNNAVNIAKAKFESKSTSSDKANISTSYTKTKALSRTSSAKEIVSNDSPASTEHRNSDSKDSVGLSVNADVATKTDDSNTTAHKSQALSKQQDDCTLSVDTVYLSVGNAGDTSNGVVTSCDMEAPKNDPEIQAENKNEPKGKATARSDNSKGKSLMNQTASNKLSAKVTTQPKNGFTAKATVDVTFLPTERQTGIEPEAGNESQPSSGTDPTSKAKNGRTNGEEVLENGVHPDVDNVNGHYYPDDIPLTNRVALWQKKAEDHQRKQMTNPFSSWDGASTRTKLSKDHADYGRPVAGSSTEKRGKAAANHIMKEISHLCYVVEDLGEKNDSGMFSVTFGALFKAFETINDMVVGLLMRARKQRLLHFEGEMLFQNRDENVVITLLPRADETKGEN